MPTSITHLLDSFRHLFLSLHRTPPLALFDELVALYSEPTRYYHNLHHLAHCLAELHSVPTPNSQILQLALWFHDAIYNPTRSDNEAQSAALAAARLTTLQFSGDQIAAIAHLIQITDHRPRPTSSASADSAASATEQLVLDIDLAILGQPPATFDLYELNIRREYAHVSEPAFRAGRGAILRSFLDRPCIYHTPHFHGLYESQARANLARSLACLSSPLPSVAPHQGLNQAASRRPT